MHQSPLNYLRTLTIAFIVLLSTSVFASPIKAIPNLESLSLDIKISTTANDHTSLTITTTTTTILTTDQGPEMELNRERKPAFESLDHCAPSGCCCSGLCYREAEDEYGICV
ncbi:uncharacterized protein RSE6_08464 [Rhynchosporium secalis]|uniref:Uncharacterized protein n=1 Tax=Rhynchosporium secalis TaxID=38038 RepID=A0A1E1MFH0_RHYSE|nr:uncharacterized protein RSE6_08464 [Rhynchosporium secalis]